VEVALEGIPELDARLALARQAMLAHLDFLAVTAAAD
jgi:hypothetical protein